MNSPQKLKYDNFSRNEPNYKWMNITSDFFKVCGELQLGELVHDKYFGLFEAMSAIEMMDPKMDAGMQHHNQTILGFDKSVALNKLKIRDVSMTELIGIIDDSYACLVTWLEGHSLAQTVFTNLYLHKPHEIEDRCTKAFSLATLKIVDMVREIVSRASVFEEEDFQPVTYGFKLSADVAELRVIGMVKEAEEDVQRIVKSTRVKQGEVRDDDIAAQHDMASALYCRLKFTRLFLASLVCFTKREDMKLVVADILKHLTQCRELLQVIHMTVDIGNKPNSENTASGTYPTIMGFEPLVNQRLLPPTFPRYTRIKSRTESLTYLDVLLSRLVRVCSVVDCNGFHSVLEFMRNFSSQGACVLSRSALQLVYVPEDRNIFGTIPVIDVLRDTVKNFICPPALVQRSSLASNPQAKEFVDAFLTQASRPFCALLQITGHNRARQRDKLAHVLEELSNLQDEADKVDAFLHNLLIKQEPQRQHLACFGSWVLSHVIQVMIQYLLLGFELELYSPHEYHYIYWYLFEMLYGWLISVLSRADGFCVEYDNLSEQQKGKKKKNKKKKPRPYAREITIAQAQQNLCGGIYKAMVGFQIVGKQKTPMFEFDSEQVRYEHRFGPFGTVNTPPPVPYHQFKDMTEMTDLGQHEVKPTSRELFMSACKCFHQAKTLYESLTTTDDESQALLKVAKTNFVVLKLLASGHKVETKEPPEFIFSPHKSFPIIKIT